MYIFRDYLIFYVTFKFDILCIFSETIEAKIETVQQCQSLDEVTFFLFNPISDRVQI